MLESFDKNKLIIFSCVVALVVGLIGFFIYKGLSKPPPEKMTLQFWGTFDDGSYYEDAIKGFKATNPNVNIVFRQLPYGEYHDALVKAFAANAGPDIFMIHNTWLPQNYNYVQPMPDSIPDYNKPDEQFTFKKFQEIFTDVAVNDLTVDQTVFGVPLYIDTLALYYNKDLFNTAGITTPPKTWEEFVKDIPLLTKKNSQGNITQSAAAIGTAKNINRSIDVLSLLMLQSGARMTNDANTSATFAEPISGFQAGQQALEFYTDFANPAKTDRYTWNDQLDYSIDAFANGKTAMMFNYSHHLATLHEKSLRLNFGVAMMPQPVDAKIRVDYANYWGLVVAKQSKHPVEAWKFLTHIRRTDEIIPYINISQRPPARKDLIDKLRNNPEFGVFAPQALTARSWYQVETATIESLFAKMIDDVNFNRATIRAALDEAQNKVNVLMKKAK